MPRVFAFCFLLMLLPVLGLEKSDEKCKIWNSESVSYPSPLVELKSFQEYVYIKPGPRFKKIAFDLKIRAPISSSFLTENPVVINSEDLKSEESEDWKQIYVTISLNKHLFKPDSYVIEAELSDGRIVRQDTGYWHRSYTKKAISISVLGDANVTFSCEPIQQAKYEEPKVGNHWKNIYIWSAAIFLVVLAVVTIIIIYYIRKNTLKKNTNSNPLNMELSNYGVSSPCQMNHHTYSHCQSSRHFIPPPTPPPPYYLKDVHMKASSECEVSKHACKELSSCATNSSPGFNVCKAENIYDTLPENPKSDKSSHCPSNHGSKFNPLFQKPLREDYHETDSCSNYPFWIDGRNSKYTSEDIYENFHEDEIEESSEKGGQENIYENMEQAIDRSQNVCERSRRSTSAEARKVDGSESPYLSMNKS